jgi:hypothetical protein
MAALHAIMLEFATIASVGIVFPVCKHLVVFVSVVRNRGTCYAKLEVVALRWSHWYIKTFGSSF